MAVSAVQARLLCCAPGARIGLCEISILRTRVVAYSADLRLHPLFEEWEDRQRKEGCDWRSARRLA
jgi:hypothetical protein